MLQISQIDLDVLQLFVCDSGEVREIEAQMVRRNQRPGLLHVLAEHFAQARMEQVRSRVIAHGGCAEFQR